MNKIKKSTFVKSVAQIAGGTAFSQLIAVLVLPLLTRLYTPGDFSILAMYAGLLSILVAIACLRLEVAIPMPADNVEAASLLVLSIIGAFLVTLVTSVVVFVLSDQIVDITRTPELQGYLWLLPVGVLIGGAYNAFLYWSTREGMFYSIARTKLYQSIVASAVQVIVGLYNGAVLGLLFGYLLNVGAGSVLLAKNSFARIALLIKELKLVDLKIALIKYKSYPKYSTIEALINTAGAQLPIIIIATKLNSPDAGFLMLALRVMQAPMALIGSSISQVYLFEAPAKYREGVLFKLTGDVLSSLFKIGVGPLLFIGIMAPELFEFVFGEKWRLSGELVVWMLPWFIFQFVSSPISMIMHVVGRQRDMMFLTAFGFFVRVGSVLLASLYGSSDLAVVYALSGGVFYFVCFFVFSRASNISSNGAFRLFLDGLPLICAWTVAGFVLKFLLNGV